MKISSCNAFLCKTPHVSERRFDKQKLFNLFNSIYFLSFFRNEDNTPEDWLELIYQDNQVKGTVHGALFRYKGTV